MKARRTIGKVIGGLLSLALLLAGPGPAGAKETKMMVGFSGLGGFQLPLWLGADTRVFERYGIHVVPVFVPSASNAVKTLISGDVQATQTSASAPVQAIINGGDLVILASSFNLLPYDFIAAKGINKPADLKGKRVGILNFGGASEYAVVSVLQRWGLNPRQDVTLVQVGNDPTRLAAVASGNIQGTVLTFPALFKAENLGLHTLANLSELGIKYPTNVVTVRRPWLREHSGEVENFLKGFAASIHSVQTQEKESMRVLAKYTKIEDPDFLVRTVRYFRAHTPRDPRLDPSALKSLLKTLDKKFPGVSRRPLKDFVDNGPLEGVERSGFITGLYR